ncbi:MAG TPA: DUF1015 domain-containing protein [Acidimicrobiales bacterium]|nr:DUF1015 domain-containing protein [Acidimicrobiales bacterium]
MPRFEPFAGVRYDLDRVDLDDVVAPPYDVIGPEEQSALEGRSPHNVVRIDIPRDAGGGRDRYAVAGALLDEWLAAGVLRTDPEPGFYAYRMGYHDVDGNSRQIVGVLGALELVAPGEGDVLPHEETQSKVRDDRLRLRRACRADLSPVWGLSMAQGLSELCSTAAPGAPVARCTDEEGVHHRLWRLSRPGVVEAVTAAVGSAPVVIADGHHRYSVALVHRDEVRAARGRAGGDEDLLLALVCELADSQAGVRPIHRLVTDLPPGFDLLAALDPFFEPVADSGPPSTLPDRMADAGALGLLAGGDQAWLLVPRPSAGATGGADGTPPDAALLDAALATLPPHTLGFEHSLDAVLAQVSSGKASAGVLLRPVDVHEIARTALAGRRMPTKTTFFHPKPRTGMVFRRLGD